MNDNLYFIPIITEALQKTDPKKSLRRVFDRIQSLGERPQYRVGFKQFERFMAIVESGLDTGNDDLDEADAMSTLITELVTDMFEGGDDERQKALNVIRSQPQWRKEYGNLTTEMDQLNQRPSGFMFLVFRENRRFGSVVFSKIPESKMIENITSGSYSISLDNGRLIWEGRLTERDLLWTRAFPGKALQLAADTGERKGHPSKTFRCIEGGIGIRVFPGIESGSIEITLNTSGDL